MMHEPLNGRKLTAREAIAVEKNEAARAMRDWLRAAAADRSPDGIHGGPFWYLIRVRRGAEWKTAAILRMHGIMAWCPRRIAVEKKPRGQGKRRFRQVICQGYLFVQIAPCAHAVHGVMTFRDLVHGFVGCGERPYMVRTSDIKALRDEVARLPSVKDGGDSLFAKGTMVLIKDGPFVGFEGCVERPDNARGRLHAEVSLFGRATLCEFELDQLARL